MRLRRALPVAAVLAGFAACQMVAGLDDLKPRSDASVVIDAQVADAPLADARPFDAMPPDAMPPDARPIDAMPPDAGANCGDGILQSPETCDPGGTTDTATCNMAVAAGSVRCRAATCGDGYKNTAAGETCDPGSTDTATCNGSSAGPAKCHAPACGDGYTNSAAGEECDDGNTVNSDACLNNCRVATCGDGFVHSGVETCDNGAANGATSCPYGTASCSGCNSTCTSITALTGNVCGDGVVAAGFETCDDHNTNPCGTCSADCQTAQAGGNCPANTGCNSNSDCTSGSCNATHKCN